MYNSSELWICDYRCDGCEAVLQGIETQISKANQNKDNNIRIKQKTDQEVRIHLINHSRHAMSQIKF